MAVPFSENRSKYMRFGVTQLQSFIAHELFEHGGEGGAGRQDSVLRVGLSGASTLPRASAASLSVSPGRDSSVSGSLQRPSAAPARDSTASSS